MSCTRKLLNTLHQQRVFHLGFKVAVPTAVITAVIKYISLEEASGHYFAELVHPSAFSSFTILISLFLAFRASHAYSRFWAGTLSLFGISSDFYDVASSLVAFSRNCTATVDKVSDFQHLIVRLFSMLHALILADLEKQGHMTGREQALKYELIDVTGIDSDSLERLKNAGPRKIDLVFQWLQSVIVEGQQAGVVAVPAPILSRVFQELNSGIMEYHRTLSLAEVPFPAPYTVATHVVLVLHWLLTPFVASTWSTHIWSASCLGFMQVFMLWSLNAIAQELENPFGEDANDLDTWSYHRELNDRLLFLLGTAKQQTPTLTAGADRHLPLRSSDSSQFSFDQVWFGEESCALHISVGNPHEDSEPPRSSEPKSADESMQQAEHATHQGSSGQICDSAESEHIVIIESQSQQETPPNEPFMVETLNFQPHPANQDMCPSSCSVTGDFLRQWHSNASSGQPAQPISTSAAV